MKRLSAVITRILALLILVTLISKIVSAEPAPETGDSGVESQNKTNLAGMPIVFYSDETKLAGGGAAQIVYQGEADKYSSSIGVMAFYTQKKQYSFGIGPEMYFKDGVYKFTADTGYLYFPDTFYGIGNNTDIDDEEVYTSRLYRLSPKLQKKVFSNLYVGTMFDVAHAGISKTENDGILAKKTITGSSDGYASGLGVLASWDSRDSNLYPTEGSFHQFAVSSYGSALGSDFTFNSYQMELRHYRKISSRHVLAFRGVFCVETGDPPFQLMNRTILRGYTQSRFIDKNVVLFEAEYRMKIYKRFGLVGFAGFGEVADKLGNITFEELKPAGGLGLRFMLIPEQNINLRIDFGVGKDDGSLDINIMEAF